MQILQKSLCHHPSLSEFLANTLDDIIKQCDIARFARFFTHRRRPKYFIKDELIIETLGRIPKKLKVLGILGIYSIIFHIPLHIHH